MFHPSPMPLQIQAASINGSKICLGDKMVNHSCSIRDIDAFDRVIGADFVCKHPQVRLLSMQKPYALTCNFGNGLYSVPLEL